MNKKSGYWLSYFFLWVFCYLLYPSWLIPGPPLRRYIWLLSLLCYFVVLSILFFKKVDIPDTGNRIRFALLERRDSVFAGAVIVFTLLHIYPMVFLPLRTWTDESSHACSGIQILQALSSGFLYSRLEFSILQWLARLAVLAGILIGFKCKPWKYFKKLSAGENIFLATIIVVLLSHLMFFLLKDAPFYGYLYKPPALSRWLSLGTTILAEPNTFWARSHSLLFCILSSVLIYEMVALLGYRDLARIAAVLLLFFPNVSYYSSSATLGAGTLFFSLLPLYFLIHFLKSKNYSALHWCFFCAAAGFLWKRPLITGEIYLILILILYHIFIEPVSIKSGLVYWFFSLGTIIPLLAIGQLEITLPHEQAKIGHVVSFCPLLQIEGILRYLGSMPEQIGFMGVGLFFAGLIFFLLWKAYFRKFWPFAISFLCWYAALTMALRVYPLPPPNPRWQLPLYPFVAVCTAFCFKFLMSKWRKTGTIVFSGYLTFMILCSTFLHFSPLHKEYSLYRTDFPNPTHLGGFLPYEKMILYMKEHLPPRSKVMADDFPDPREFYSFKHHLNVEWKLIKLQNELLPGIEGLYEKAESEGVFYLFLPEPSYLVHIDRTAAKAIFAGEEAHFPRVKIFTGRNGRVGLFEIRQKENN